MRRRRGAGATGAACVAAALLLLAAPAAEAQDGRGSLRSMTRYVELRPLREDTIPREQVTALPDGSFRYEGLPASCDEARCFVLRAGPVEHGIVATHDANFTVWGLGVQGLSATGLVRSRAHLGGAFRDPLAGEAFEAILGYAELVRGVYRVRAGRQRELTGLGYSGFDGIDVMVEPRPALRLQLYGGRSLARGMQQPYARAFRGLDEQDFVRDRNAYVLGVEAGVQTPGGSTAALHWQASLWGDRAGFLSDRALLVGQTAELRPLHLSGSAEYDIGMGRLGSAHLDARLPLPARALSLEATARRHLPFFEYWTIWGMFSPVAWHEAELRVAWRPAARAGVRAAAAYRVYEPHETQTFQAPLQTRSWRASLGGDWQASGDVRIDARLAVEGPVGAFTLAGDATLDWRVSDRVALLLHGLVLEQAEEFRLGAGVLAGGGAGAEFRLRDDLHAGAGLEIYRQAQPDRPGGVDWTQRRGWLSLRVLLGGDPGLRGRDAP